MGKRGNSKTRDAKKGDAKEKAKGKAKAIEGIVPLKRSFHEGRLKAKETSPKKQKQQEADPPRKVMTSNFLSYLVCAEKSVNADVVGQAEYIADHYFKAGMDEKKAIVDGFYIELEARDLDFPQPTSNVSPFQRPAQMLSGRATSLVAC